MYFIEENAFEHVVSKMAAILSRPQCIKPLKYVKRYLYIQTRHRELFCALHIYRIFHEFVNEMKAKIRWISMGDDQL